MFTEKETQDKICEIFKNMHADGRHTIQAINEYERLELDFLWSYLELIEKNKTEDEHRKDCEENKAYRRELLRAYRKYGVRYDSKIVEDELKNYPSLIVKCSIEKCDIKNCQHNYHETINNY